MTHKEKIKFLDLAAILLIAVFAFFISLFVWQGMVSPEDPLTMFDGGYRILSGQIPFKDFLYAHGLMVFYILALFFKFLGVSFTTYIICAASINVIATICSMLMIRFLFPRWKYLSYISGLLTAILFNAPFTTPWPDQSTLFFVYVALALVLFALCRKRLKRFISLGILFVGGAISFLTFLAKQNAGIVSIPLYPVLIAAASISDKRLILKRCVVFFAGFLTSVACFLLWLFERSSLDNFIQYYIVLPLKMGESRIGPALSALAVGRLGYLALFVVPIIVIWLYFLNIKKFKDEWRNQFIAAFLCLGLFFVQFFFNHTNGCSINLSSQCLIFVIEIGLLFSLLNIDVPFHTELKLPKRTGLKRALIALTSLLFVAFSLKGFKLYSSNFLHEAKSDSYADLTKYLKDTDRNFFVFPGSFPAIYGMLGKPSPQPMLCFNKGVTYGEKYDPVLDSWIVKSLKKNAVQVAILEDMPPPEGDEYMFDDFPLFKSYILGNFSKTREIGIFKIYELNKGDH